MKKVIHVLLFLVAFNSVVGQDDYVKDNFIRYKDWIYRSNIRTVELRETSFELAAPLIELGSSQQLVLSFDDLDGGYENYSYTLIHCDASWNPSDLVMNEYLGGFFEDNISNYTYSVNTLQKYTHYKVTFPNNNMHVTKPGNYIVFVYENSEKEMPVLTKRFMVYQNLVNIVGNVHQAASAEDYFNKHEVDFSVFYSNYTITNPFQDLKVVVTQNNRWDNAITNLVPMFTKQNELTFDYDDGSNCFNGGNEFRIFDNKSFKFLTTFVSKNYKDSLSQNHTLVIPDENKHFKRYMFYPDINSEFYIRNTEMENNDNESDYAWVHFFIPYDTPLAEGSFHVTGKFCDWKTDKTNKLVYNPRKMGYEAELFLKQGYYNYQYVYIKDGKAQADETMLEGNHWETENDYSIYVYHRKIGTYYDQLVGIKKLNSIRK